MANVASRSVQAAEPPLHRVTRQADGWTIALDIEGGVIAKASLQWSDPRCDVSFLALLAQRLKGLSLREARDHGVQHACLVHHAANPKPVVAGIMVPANYSPTSRAALVALRAAIDPIAKPDPAAWNFEDHAFSHAWLKLPAETRRQRIEVLVDAFLEKAGHPGAASITEIDAYDRVFLQFAIDFPVALKPPMLMEMERHIRGATGERIELFVSEMKDNNRIRRL